MSTSHIPSLDFGGEGPNLLFLHANGYPPACYRDLLSRLAGSGHHVIAMAQRPLWKGSHPHDVQDWKPFSDDLLRFLDQIGQSAPVTVIGHSLGGVVTLRAAIRNPERFHSIILLDPVLFQPHFIVTWNIARALRITDYMHPLIPATKKRRRKFDNLDLLFSTYRRRPVFKYLDDNALRAYVEGITCPVEGGYKLCYSAEWESHIYYTSIWRDMELWRALPNLKVPTLIVRGDETDTFFESTARRVERVNPAIRVETIPQSTHLFPLEKPQEASQIIQDFLADV
jgi:pimeloyl-ACP methyl ester carboxylesterase